MGWNPVKNYIEITKIRALEETFEVYRWAVSDVTPIDVYSATIESKLNQASTYSELVTVVEEVIQSVYPFIRFIYSASMDTLQGTPYCFKRYIPGEERFLSILDEFDGEDFDRLAALHYNKIRERVAYMMTNHREFKTKFVDLSDLEMRLESARYAGLFEFIKQHGLYQLPKEILNRLPSSGFPLRS